MQNNETNKTKHPISDELTFEIHEVTDGEATLYAHTWGVTHYLQRLNASQMIALSDWFAQQAELVRETEARSA